ncbi:MAG: AraC family transcriptional regulator [Clostridia bacterium]|nr:AraC family transcriptional regulator [Clostridia bacterium]
MQYNRQSLPDMQIYHTALPKGKRDFREHHHTECEISLILSGEGVYVIGGREYAFSAGDILLFGSNEPHCITEIMGDAPFDMLTVKFEPKALWSGTDSEATLLLKLFFNRDENVPVRISKADAEAKQVSSLMLEAEQELIQKNVGYALKIRILLYTALLGLLRAFGYEEGAHTPREQNTACLSLAMDYIGQNLSSDLSLEEIASVAAMSKAYFSTVFKKFNGISPWDYITIKRVERAIMLLKTTNLKKLEIAEECGFRSAANFYKAFKKVTGKMPKDYL